MLACKGQQLRCPAAGTCLLQQLLLQQLLLWQQLPHVQLMWHTCIAKTIQLVKSRTRITVQKPLCINIKIDEAKSIAPR